MAKFLTNVPYTEAGKKLDLSEELKEKCRLVYREQEGGGYVFYDLWDENTEYGDDCVILALQSAYDGVEHLEQGKKFANILGSTNDPQIDGESWINLIIKIYTEKRIYGDAAHAEAAASECCTDGFFYIPYSGDEKITDNNGNDKIHDGYYRVIGGHVLLDQDDAQAAAHGGVVYLLPICNTHNSYFHRINPTIPEPKQSGKGFYMKVGEGGAYAVRLKNYFEKG